MNRSNMIGMAAALLGAAGVIQTSAGQVSPDFNSDSVVTPSDLAAFTNEWVAELSNNVRVCDMDDDSFVTPADISAFVSMWFAAAQGGYTPPPGPAAPTLLRLVDQGDNQHVRVTWKDNSTSETGFELIRQTHVVVGGQTDYIAWTTLMQPANAQTYDDAPGSGTFRYKVRAMASGPDSLYTPWVYITVGGNNPPATGACCTGTTCTITTQAACGGSWGGAGTTCSPTTCGTPPPPPPPGSGWTDLTPLPGSRVVYVSSSSGNDGNSGLSQSQPVRSLWAGLNLLRSGQPDQMLLKKGDTWNENLPLTNRAQGASATARSVIGAYATGPRPRIVGQVYRGSAGESRGNLIIAGLEIVAPSTGNAEGIAWQGGPDAQPAGGENVLIEDCYIHHWRNNVTLQGMYNVTIRRCVLADSTTYDPNEWGRSSGLYFGLCSGITVEENILDHNGWPASGYYSHNVYVQSDNLGTIIFRRNISVGASSHGVQMRSGGLTEDNIFVRNPMAVQYGHSQADYYPNGVTGTIRGNIVMEGSDINAQELRGVGIKLSNVSTQGVVVENNIIASKLSGNAGGGIEAVSDVRLLGAQIRNNAVYNWTHGITVGGPNRANIVISGNTCANSGGAGPLINLWDTTGVSMSSNRYQQGGGTWFEINEQGRSFTQWQSSMEPTALQGVSFPDPNRSLGSYAATRGLGSTHEAMMAALRNQSKDTWNSAYSIDALLTYFRAGFGR